MTLSLAHILQVPTTLPISDVPRPQGAADAVELGLSNAFNQM